MMRRRSIALLCLAAAVACGDPASDAAAGNSVTPSEQASDSAVSDPIVRLEAAFDSIVPSGAALEVLAEGHAWTEGPVWVPELGGLLYSDIPANAIHLFREGAGAKPWLEPTEDDPSGSGGSNGLILDAAGRLLLAQHYDRRIARFEGDLASAEGDFVTLAADGLSGRLNSPNDLVEGPGGDLYFTDPPYGLQGQDDDPARELEVNGVYRLRPDGDLEIIEAGLSRPNGIALSPDGRTLYVASSADSERVVMAYDVAPDGSVGEGRVFAPTWGDGLAVDTAGNVFVAEPERGVFVYDAAGRHLGAILTGQRTSNVTWGDDGSTLYITASAYLMRIRLGTVGVGF